MADLERKKVNQLSSIGNIQPGDKLVGERTDGTTVLITYQESGGGGAVDSVNGQTGVVVLDPDDLNDAATTNKFTTASDIAKLAAISGTNTGDQTSIVGITGTKAEFDSAVTDGNILYVGDVTQYTDEMSQDAVGAMVDTSLVYTDSTPLLQRAALTGDVTASTGSNSTTIANDVVTYAKMQNVSDTDKLLGRSTSGAGDVEEIACTAAGRALIDDADASAQRTTLGLGTLATQSGTFSGTSSGTNTGDQTSIVGITGTKAEFDTAVTDGNILYVGDAYVPGGTDVIVADGGTGRSTATAYAPLVGGTTSTGAHQSTASGSTGQILQSAGNAAVPTWSTPTYPSASGTARKILVSDGTNNIYSTETYAVPGTAGNHLRSDGTNWTSAKVALTTDVSGVLPEANGGTNQSTYTTGDTLYASGSNTLSKRAIGVTGSYYTVVSGAPAWKGGLTAFKASLGSNQTVTSGVITKIQCNTEAYDTGSMYDNATNFRHTPTIAGIYSYKIWVFGGTNVANGVLVPHIYKNGVTEARSFAYFITADNIYACVALDISMNGSTDYVECYALVTGVTIFAGSWFSGCLIQPS